MKNPMKTAIKTVKDIQSGAILETKKGHEYVLLRDDAGVPSMYGKDGRWVRLNPDALCDVKGGHEIAKISAFVTMPQADQISEAIKYLYTGRTACAPLTVIHEVENAEVKAAKANIEDITAQMNALGKLLEKNFAVLCANGINEIEIDLDGMSDDDDDYDEDDYDDDYDDEDDD